MSIYVHRGSGHYIGSVVVCFAKDDEQARQIVRGFLDEAGLSDEKVNIHPANDFESGIIYAQDGDY